ncbi:MAG: SLBB domain-containing protein [Chloracidobacterium sp.]|nr:SLBB domain-containing protein [Chloracidobacterium sp.]
MSSFRQFLIVFACLLVLCGGAGAQGIVAGDDPDSLVHFGDLIDVDVLGGFEFDWRGRLDPEGFLGGFDSYGDAIFGHCRSVDQIAADISKAFSKMLRDPQVVVRIIDRSNRPTVRLDGAVRTPTRFRLLRGVNLRELIVMAGGLTEGASGGISIFRPGNASCSGNDADVRTIREAALRDNASRTINLKISELLSGSGDADPRILSGDLISVVRADPVYVIGAVNNPRPIYSALEMTVTRAIAAAGGPAKGADKQRITLFRKDQNDSRVIETSLQQIERGQVPDIILKPFDILEVGTKGGPKRQYPPVIAGDDNGSLKTELPLRVVN